MLAELSTRHPGWVGAGQDADRADRRRLALGGVVSIRSEDRDAQAELLARTSPSWIWWWCTSASTSAWSRTGSASTARSTRCCWSIADSTDNAALVTDVVVGPREGAWTSAADPGVAGWVQGGAPRAVLDAFDRPVIGRCQLHKIRHHLGGPHP